MAFDINAIFDDPRFAEALTLFGASGPHNAGLMDAAKTMQHMKQLKAQREQAQWEREHAGKKLSLEQSEHESMKGYRAGQLDVASAGAVTSRMNAQAQADQNKRIEAQQAQKAAFLRGLAKDPRFAKFAPLLGGLGGVQPEGQPAPVMPDAPSMTPQSTQAPALEVPRGKYGTPVAILDGLAKTESSNNPIALGPIIGYKNGKPIRAEGMYQHLPDTRDMLRTEIGNYDPFKPKEARDATDYYLQKLHKQHGGDWNKTLAAYGGFKTKDPTAYIQKVMGGSNEKQAIAHAASQNATSSVNPFAESQELQQLAGILTFVDEGMGKGFEMMAKGMQPQKVEGGGMYQTPQGMVRVPQTPEQIAEEARKRAAEGRAVEDQNIQRNEALYKESQRKAEEEKKAVDLRKAKADVAEKETKAAQEVATKKAAQENANKMLDAMLTDLTQLEKNTGAVDSGKGRLHNLIARAASTEVGQEFERWDGTKNQAARDNIRTSKTLLLPALMQATGLSAKMMDSIREFDAYKESINDPKADISVQRNAVERLRAILAGNAPLSVKQADGSIKTMTLEEARASQPAEPAATNKTIVRQYKGAKSGKTVIEYSDGTTEYGR